jgi:hypothetical protein
LVSGAEESLLDAMPKMGDFAVRAHKLWMLQTRVGFTPRLFMSRAQIASVGVSR